MFNFKDINFIYDMFDDNQIIITIVNDLIITWGADTTSGYKVVVSAE